MCAVCHRQPESDNDAQLQAEGWVVEENLLCPSCKSDGWQLPPGATLPFRSYVRRGDEASG